MVIFFLLVVFFFFFFKKNPANCPWCFPCHVAIKFPSILARTFTAEAESRVKCLLGNCPMARARAIAMGRRICYRSEHVTLGSMLFSIKLEATGWRLRFLMALLQSLSSRGETWMRKYLFLQVFIICIDVSKRLFDFKNNYIIILFSCWSCLGC